MSPQSERMEGSTTAPDRRHNSGGTTAHRTSCTPTGAETLSWEPTAGDHCSKISGININMRRRAAEIEIEIEGEGGSRETSHTWGNIRCKGMPKASAQCTCPYVTGLDMIASATNSLQMRTHTI